MYQNFLLAGALIMLALGLLAELADGPRDLPWRDRLWQRWCEAVDRLTYHFEVRDLGEHTRASFREGYDTPLVADWHFVVYRVTRRWDRIVERVLWRAYRVLVLAPHDRKMRRDGVA